MSKVTLNDVKLRIAEVLSLSTGDVAVIGQKHSYTNSHVIVEVGDVRYVVKIFREGSSSYPSNIRALREKYGLEVGHSLGISPKYVELSGIHQELGKQPYVVYEYVFGEVVGVSSFSRQTARRVGHLLARLHTSTCLGSPDCLDFGLCQRDLNTLLSRNDKLVSQICEMYRYLPYQVQDLVCEIPRLESAHRKLVKKEGDRVSSSMQTITHGDFGLHNILVTERGDLSVIDWEYTANRDPAYELANLFLYPESHHVVSRMEKEILEGYRSVIDETLWLRIENRLIFYKKSLCFRWLLRVLAGLIRREEDAPKEKEKIITRRITYVVDLIEKCERSLVAELD